MIAQSNLQENGRRPDQRHHYHRDRASKSCGAGEKDDQRQRNAEQASAHNSFAFAEWQGTAIV